MEPTIADIALRYATGERAFRSIEIDPAARRLGSLILEEADFSGSWVVADFRKANLRGASFRNANVKTCDFSGADLTNADFRGAALDATIFKGATMNGASFAGATISGSELTDGELPTW